MSILTGFSGKPLSNSALIPAQLRGKFPSNWRNEMQKLRPVDRGDQITNFLAAGELAGFFTAEAFDEEILNRCGEVHWDIACSYGFAEGDWESWPLLRCLSHSAAKACHFYEHSTNSPGTEKWKKLCGYEGKCASVNASMESYFTILRVQSVSAAVEVICKSIDELVLRNGKDALRKMPIAVAFSRSHGYHLALRDRLLSSGIAHVDLLPRRCQPPCNFLLRKWFAYQKRQKRRECLELLRSHGAELGWNFARISSAENEIVNYCQRNFSDNCGSELVESLKLPWTALVKNATAEEFLRMCCHDFPQLAQLEDKIAPLASLYEILSREEFLQWLAAEISTLWPREDGEPLDPNAIVHLAPWEAVSPEWHGHLIGADTATEDFPMTKNGAVFCTRCCGDDFYYTSPMEKISQLTWRLRSTVEKFSSGRGIFIEKPNRLLSGEIRSMAPPFSGFRHGEIFELEAHTKVQSSEVANCQPFPPITATAAVRNGRLDGTNHFGAYDFGFGSAGAVEWSKNIPCKVWERILKSPEDSWFQHILQLATASQWIVDDIAQLVGTRVHQLVAEKLDGNDVPTADFAKWRGTLGRSAAMQVFGFASDLVHQAEELQRKIYADESSHEVPLDGTVYVCGDAINLHGRADLILKTPGDHCTVIDFKTGSPSTPLTAKGICRGDFLQLALYGKIMENNCAHCSIAVIFPFSRIKQLPMEELREENSPEISNFWRFFSRLWKTLNCGYAAGRDETFIAFAHEQIANDIVANRRRASGFNLNEGDLP
jgi:hypothetical protein